MKNYRYENYGHGTVTLKREGSHLHCIYIDLFSEFCRKLRLDTFMLSRSTHSEPKLSTVVNSLSINKLLWNVAAWKLHKMSNLWQRVEKFKLLASCVWILFATVSYNYEPYQEALRLSRSNVHCYSELSILHFSKNSYSIELLEY